MYKYNTTLGTHIATCAHVMYPGRVHTFDIHVYITYYT